MNSMFAKGTEIWSRDGRSKGVTTGGQHLCRLSGCLGLRIAVRWPDGRHTFPCSKGIIAKRGRWQIG